jgi:hypothetical protein
MRDWDTVLPRDQPRRHRPPPAPPRRVRLSRVRGWRKPPNTIVVSRPGRWGNPFLGDPQRAVAAYREWLTSPGSAVIELPTGVRAARTPGWHEAADLRALLPTLRGHNLGCWCSLSAPCHADVLLALANPAP